MSFSRNKERKDINRNFQHVTEMTMNSQGNFNFIFSCRDLYNGHVIKGKTGPIPFGNKSALQNNCRDLEPAADVFEPLWRP